MFLSRFFNPRYFADRYFAKVGADSSGAPAGSCDVLDIAAHTATLVTRTATVTLIDTPGY